MLSVDGLTRSDKITCVRLSTVVVAVRSIPTAVFSFSGRLSDLSRIRSRSAYRG